MEQSSFMLAEQCSLSFDSDHLEDEESNHIACSRPTHSLLPLCPQQDVTTLDKKCIAINDSPERENSSNIVCPSPPKSPVKVRHYVVKNLNSSSVDTTAASPDAKEINGELRGESFDENETLTDPCNLKVHQGEPSWVEPQSSPMNQPPPRESMLLRAPHTTSVSPKYNDSQPSGIGMDEEKSTICPLYDQKQHGKNSKKGLLTSTGGRKQLDGFGSEDINSREPAYRNLMGNSVKFGHKTYSKVVDSVCKGGIQTTDCQSVETDNNEEGITYTRFLALPSHEVSNSGGASQTSQSKGLSVAARMRLKYHQFTGHSLESTSHDSEDCHLDVESNLEELKLSLNDDVSSHHHSRKGNDISVVDSLRHMMQRSQRKTPPKEVAFCDDLNCGNGNANGTDYEFYNHDLALSVATSMAPQAVDVDEVAISSIFERNKETGHVHVHLPKDDVRLVMAPNLEPGILCCILGSEEDYELYHRPQSKQLLRTLSTESSDSSCEAYEDEEAAIGLVEERKYKKRSNSEKRGRRSVRPLKYILTVDADLYKRVLHEVAAQWSTPCGLYFCGQETEDSRPSIFVAFFLVAVILLGLFIPTLVWPTD